jgi:polysaccharide biosynthesis transport protein
MAAVITAPTDSQQTLERLRSLWRLRGTFWWVASGALLITALLALLLPSVYRSQATILIEQQEIPQDLVRSSITSFADERIQTISQRVMTGQNLMKIIDQYQLYPERRHREPREVLLKRMRGDIEMKTITADVIDPRNGRPTQATIAFSVAYESHSPDLALKVASELTTLYLNENLTSRTQVAKQNADFLAGEADRQQKRVDDIDTQVAAFKEKHHDRLPELATLNIEVMNRTELDLHDVQNRLQGLGEQRVLLEAQLAQINPTSRVLAGRSPPVTAFRAGHAVGNVWTRAPGRAAHAARDCRARKRGQVAVCRGRPVSRSRISARRAGSKP